MVKLAERLIREAYGEHAERARASYDLALVWYEKAAASGDVKIMVRLAGELAKGTFGETKERRDRALAWYVRAAEKGDLETMRYLAQWYSGAEDSPVILHHDDAEALRWLRRAADAGDAWALDEIGLGYGNGRYGLPKSIQQAIEWERRAAKADSQYERILAQFLGESGDPKLEEEALLWYRKAWLDRRAFKDELKALLEKHPKLRTADDPE